MNSEIKSYDYIIAGSGCAGLSLLYRLLQEPKLKDKKILMLDKDHKNTNDRTWCFWEKDQGIFESTVTHQWKKLEFKTEKFERRFELKNYAYKMIKGIDFYEFVLNFAKHFDNVEFRYEDIKSIESFENFGQVETNKHLYSADYIFNSTPLFNPEINIQNSLLQHFTGWVIKTEKPAFDSEVGTLMDFTVHQKNGDTFMYVLPTSSTEALVEYTLFSEKVLDKEEYKTALENYIQNDLQIDQYEITHTEFGVIPMSLETFKRSPATESRIINMGTAGGFTKASSGYTFQFIQKNTADIVENLFKEYHPNPTMTFRDKMFQWYDRTLLEVILSKKLKGKEIFAVMFKKLPPDLILKFLGNESTVSEDVKIMSTLPIKPFLLGGLKQLK